MLGASNGGTAVTINTTGVVVRLRGLVFEGFGTALQGIAFFSGRSLTIDDCVVRDFTSSGIALVPSNSSYIGVSRTIAQDNGAQGIFLQPIGSVAVTATLNHVEAKGTGQRGIGVFANQLQNPGSKAIMTAVDSVATNNGTGFYSTGAGPPCRYSGRPSQPLARDCARQQHQCAR